MRKSLVGSMVISALLLAPLTASATNPDEHFWTDSQGKVVRDGQGNCVRTMYWNAETARIECGGKVAAVAAKPVPAPVVVTPPPAPAPAPEPMPVTPPPTPEQVASPVTPKQPKAKPITLRGDTSFRSGSSELSSAARAEIASIANQIKELRKVKSIKVSGHTDSSGSDAANQQLSEARAKAVRDVFMSEGVDGSVITATGYGESQPIADNTTSAGRATNRRVEIEIDGE